MFEFSNRPLMHPALAQHIRISTNQSIRRMLENKNMNKSISYPIINPLEAGGPAGNPSPFLLLLPLLTAISFLAGYYYSRLAPLRM